MNESAGFDEVLARRREVGKIFCSPVERPLHGCGRLTHEITVAVEPPADVLLRQQGVHGTRIGAVSVAFPVIVTDGARFDFLQLFTNLLYGIVELEPFARQQQGGQDIPAVIRTLIPLRSLPQDEAELMVQVPWSQWLFVEGVLARVAKVDVPPQHTMNERDAERFRRILKDRPVACGLPITKVAWKTSSHTAHLRFRRDWDLRLNLHAPFWSTSLSAHSPSYDCLLFPQKRRGHISQCAPFKTRFGSSPLYAAAFPRSNSVPVAFSIAATTVRAISGFSLITGQFSRTKSLRLRTFRWTRISVSSATVAPTFRT